MSADGARPRARTPELRLVPAVLGAWAAGGVLVGVEPGAGVGVAAGMLWTAAALTALAAWRVRLLGVLSLALTAAAVVATVVALQGPARVPAALAAVAGHAAVDLEVVTTGAVDEGRVPGRAVLRDDPDAGEAAVLVFLADPVDGAGLRIGDRWAVQARLRAVEPGDDVAFLAFAERAPEPLAEPPPLLEAASALREGLTALSRALPGPGGRLLPGLAVGDTSRVDETLDGQMITSSLSHLTAVSGSNCAIVVGAVFALCALLGLPRGVRVAVALVALAGFVLLVTPQPSVLRAAAMSAVVLLALATGRPARGMPALCLAVVLLLAGDPWLARSYGFALSALATAGLLLLAAPLADALARWMPRPLALVIAVPLAAQLACQPVLLLLSPTLPLWGVPANLLAAPAAPLATVLGLVACLLAPFAPPLAAGLAAIAWLPASWIAAVAAFFAGLPGARMPWPAGAAGVAALVALTSLGLLAALGPPGARWRRPAAALALVGVLGYAGAVAGIRVAQTITRPADWQFAMCDVGQGDATVLRAGGRVALVDTGPEPAALAACLDDLGVGAIDLLVLTHYDHDHVGGTDAVLGRVGTALVGPVGDPGDERLREELLAGGARVVEAGEGMTGELGGLDWRVLWPPPSGVEPGNAASVTLLVEPGAGCGACLSGLLLGDLGEESQLRVLGAESIPAVDVLKVAHHGSADFAARLYATAAARVGLVGVGAGNDYGHPTQAALDALAASGTAVFRTDLDGLILVAPPATPDAPPRVWTSHLASPESP
ncbi:ComEC/Rec2 family competence protein [Protaetiibacter intestinalis]|uniref:MBL fold metallo-hydrolase n=1 Tax=Protaetiibacter intestinalis TaxID=2419774 RepID=A0A387B0A0_9MICO|nr:ComEC/Rec2 family competence protein [Protaetiibacter intestinalis]AYF96882.1 MBL fold metallo-hydrolase [Protaetiibacter intestinalis]